MRTGPELPMLKPAIVLSAVLLAQTGLFYGFSRSEKIPDYKPFNTFPSQLGNWRLAQEIPLDEDTKNVLRGDDYINRWYVSPSRAAAGLFVAFFKTQRAGQTPHSPKNCLPGSGWVWTTSDDISVPIAGREPITVNRYVVAKGEAKDVVLYWYQSRDRVVASEYKAMIFVAADALRYNRTDTSLVRVIVPFENNQEKAATATAIDFIQSFFGTLRSYLPA